ncbi:uncharacterized protein LOC125238671 [Leguminivora glycinivorella]|uniref:uncharacterized protein LOC125238671 n=1 Tax=Leguminivora glycinivorella TaxID=1035111 RepID=UPI00200E26C8|nr:uncharacterized protein LOC125238671 [Leguminivora glycinivorella]
MSLPDVTSARSSPTPPCPECDTSASVTSDLHKYQVACTCKPSAAYARADDPGPPPPAKPDTPPALPPRPPTNLLTGRRNNAAVNCNTSAPCRRHKYAWWCVGCGALAAALGGLLALQHIIVRVYTESPHHLETVPAAVPAAMLVLTGVCIMSLARRRNRYSYMIKVVGACCLVCALTCVLVTITTTYIHMNKLQKLQHCEYTKLTRTCTCSSTRPDTAHNSKEEELRCVFEGVTSCEVVRGALLICLRGVFGLSVCAVLVCMFSSMLAYQLLRHERKKMYWEQLELRCRSLYRPPTGQQPQPRAVQPSCSCCAQCHPTQPAWDISLQHRFWAPGRIGNLYSPNPGTVRKTSAWSWFPWPRSNSQNSRCRMGVPQSGDSAYGFCETETPTNPQGFEERFPANFQTFQRNQAGFQSSGTFQNYPAQMQQGYQGQYQVEGFGEASGSFDAQTGVWGPPPPYSPQGRSGSRHHLHQDPAAATLLHHHHIDVHRNSTHEHAMPHTCRNSYMLTDRADISQRPDPRITELARMNPELARINPELIRINPELTRINPELIRAQEIARINPELIRTQERINLELRNPDIRNSDMLGQDMRMMYQPEELGRLQEMTEGRFNTLRGHLVPYPCQRTLGMSAGNLTNLHRDCRMDDNVTVECLHQKSASKVSDQSTDSCPPNPKQGKENLGFQNDKHSPIRSSMQDCHRVNQNAESEVYFADVSSCCNVSVKADCCMNPNVSALVGTIENHPESTSESDTGSFTLTRQQRPQPQVGSKRRPRQEKHVKPRENNSVRLTEQQIEQLNNSMRMMNESRVSERMNDSRISGINDSRMSDRMNESRINDARSANDSRTSERINESRINDSRSVNDSRISERMNESRITDSRSANDSRISGVMDSRISDRMNETRLSERLNDSRISDRLNETRLSERVISDRMERDSRLSERLNDTRMSGRNDSRDRLNDSRDEEKVRQVRLPRFSPKSNHPRQLSSESNKAEFFVPPPPNLPTEKQLNEESQVYSNESETACLGPDSQYESVREEKDEIKVHHHRHCYSDTNTMDSGWQSGSEKQVTD